MMGTGAVEPGASGLISMAQVAIAVEYKAAIIEKKRE